MDLQASIAAREPDFNPELNLLSNTCNSPGYHTRLANGTRIHSTLENSDYAIALLRTDDPALHRRAREVLRRVLSRQVTDLYDPAFGIWPWFYDEPVPEMNPPDWNWADFVGARICHLLKEYRDRLPQELAAELAAALERAAWSIFRRNMQPHYTNIAIMGATVSGVAGELLGNPMLLAYGRRRLETFLDYVRKTGGLNEYNSSTYTFVALHEVERILQLSGDPELRRTAETLRRYFWSQISAQFPPATAQLAGAESRCYSDFMTSTTVEFLRETTGAELPCYFSETAPKPGFSALRHLPCPEEYREAFRRLPQPEVERRQRYIKREPDTNSFYGHTFMTETCNLGSINHDCTWVQRRPLIAYWTMPNGGTPALFRLRCLRNGHDFASGAISACQRRNQVLALFGTHCDLGDTHIGLYRPKDQTYEFSSFVFRLELTATDAAVHEPAPETYELRAGTHRVVLHTAAGTFRQEPIHWRSGGEAGKAWVEAVLYEGEPRRIRFDETLKLLAGCAIELLPAAETAAKTALRLWEEDGKAIAEWEELKLSAPAESTVYNN